MTVLATLQALALEGWRFWIDEGRLRYRAPVGAATEPVLATLRTHRDEILATLSRDPDACNMAPLSDGQRALWFLWKLAPESSAYNQSLPLRITTGHADAAVWQRACVALVTRHPMLRTLHIEHHGDPVQHVRPAGQIDWAVIDARGADDDALARLIDGAHTPPFDLAAHPPARFRWFDRGDAPPVLLITLHHIACDGWSMEVVRRELPRLAAGDHAPLAPVAATYQDYVWWQRDLLAGPEGERLAAFWRAHLAPPRPVLDLPLDHARPLVQDYAGDSIERPLPDALVAALRAVAAREGVTLYALCLAVYAAMLTRWAHGTSVIIGSPTAGRTRPEFGGVVGYFVEPLAVRLSIDPQQTWRQAFADTRHAALDTLAHRDFPFARLVEMLRVERDAGRSPLFDVTFNYVSRRLADSAIAGDAHGSDVEAFDISQAAGKFDVTLNVLEDERAMSLVLSYRTSLFDRATIETLLDWLVEALTSAAADPTATIDALALGGDAQAPALSGRRTDLSSLRPVHEQILAHAETTPNRVAVVGDDGQLTYGQLATRARGLAAQITAAARADAPVVAVLTGRTTSFVVAMLAVLESGGVFVPLDPTDPPALLAARMNRVGAAVVVCETRTQTLAASLGLPVLTADVDRSNPSNTRRAVPLDARAYVLFTSGSTGEPKAVAVPHRALANYVRSIVDDLDLQPASTFGFISSMTADLGHTSIFPSLASGGTLHVLSDRVATSSAAFATELHDHPLDYLKIVPSHFVALAGGAGDAPWPLPRKALIFGGESTPWPTAARVLAGGCRVFNHYGPTETTVGVLTYAVDPTTPPGTATLPLARAIDNTDIYLLDEQMRAVPRGWPGEVYIAGPCLANGYVGDAEQTAARFVTLPSGTRAYRTGDVARQLTTGALLLLGRRDRQINLHGYRVELGQVEAALANVHGVGHSAVFTDADGDAASMLVAWVVPTASEARITADVVQSAMAGQLPRHMVPARVIVADTLPLTVNGKLDIAAMRRTLASAAPAETASARVVDVIEWRLLELWRAVLGVGQLGPDDDFFANGGHSLMAVRLAGRISELFGIDVPLPAFFTHRTVRALARVLRDGGAGLPVLTLMAGAGDAPPLLCVPGAGGSILYLHDFSRLLDADCAVWGAQALTNPTPLTIEDAATRYLALDQSGPLASSGTIRLAGHSFGALVAFEIARQRRAKGQPVECVIVLDNVAPSIADPASAADRDDAGWLRHIALRIAKLYGLPLELSADDAAGPDGATHLIERLRAAGALPQDVRVDQFARYVDVYKANARAAATYRPPVVPIDVPIVLCRAAETDHQLELPSIAGDDSLGWQSYTTQPVRVHVVPGTHITMLNTPQVHTLADTVRVALSQETRS